MISFIRELIKINNITIVFLNLYSKIIDERNKVALSKQEKFEIEKSENLFLISSYSYLFC
jgi:hypothetical protein